MKMKNKELVNQVKNWARKCGLNKLDPLRELITNGICEDQGEVIDAVGDMQVALITYCLIRDIEYPETWYDYNFGDDAKDFDLNELKDSLLELATNVGIIAEGYDKQNNHTEDFGVKQTLRCLDVISEMFGVRKEFCLGETCESMADAMANLNVLTKGKD